MTFRDSLTLPLKSPMLDRELLEGIDPHRNAELERRGRRVCARRNRDRLANALERVVTDAEGETLAISARVPLPREDVLAARVPLLDLAGLLRADEPVDPQGVLLVRRLLSDPAGPLATGAALRPALRQAQAALVPR